MVIPLLLGQTLHSVQLHTVWTERIFLKINLKKLIRQISESLEEWNSFNKQYHHKHYTFRKLEVSPHSEPRATHRNRQHSGIRLELNSIHGLPPNLISPNEVTWFVY